MGPMEISRTGMDVEWRRLEVIADNIANANSPLNANGTGFRPQRLVSGPKLSFSKALSGEQDPSSPAGVQVYGVSPLQLPPHKIHEPGNPQADAQGYVTYAGFDQASEMTLLIKTTRAYEANVVAMNLARQMYSKAMDIGKR